MAFKFITERRVYFNDCDFYQHVNNALYLNYMDENISDFYRKHFETFAKIPFLFHWVHLEINYFKEATFDDVLIIEKTIDKIGNTSITYQYKIFNKKNNVLILEAKRVGVFLDIKTKEKTSVPQKLIDIYQN